MNAYDLHLLALAGALAGAAIGWQIVFGLAGALSLAAGAAMGLGAYAATILPQQFGWPFGLAIVAAGVLPGALLGAAGLLIARLESHYFALATLALAELAVLVATNWESLTGGASRPLAPPPAWLDAPAARAGVAWAAALAAAALFYGFQRYVGRERLALLRAQPLAARTFGIQPARIRALAMAVAGIAGGLAGAAHSVTVGVASPDGLTFKTMAAILAVVIIGGRRSPTAAGLMAIAVTWTPELLRFLEQSYLVAYGGLMLAAILFLPDGLAATLGAWRRRLWPRRPPERVDMPTPALGPVRRSDGAVIDARGLTRRFGGLTAVADIDLVIAPGEIVGLIGPNGAGKSTLLNLLCGLDQADAGALNLAHGQRIGRTFQAPALAADLDVLENARAAACTSADAWAALAAVDLAAKSDWPINRLTQADLRFLELARARAARPGLLLLDEPAAGLAPAERTVLAEKLRAAAADGAAVLVVEHDVPFLASFADRLVCMSDGRIIAAGPPEDVRRSDAVIDAYLGRAAS